MIEVLKQALDALEKVKRRAVVMGSTGDYREGQLDALKAVSEDGKPAIASLQQAIAGLESQEPVAYIRRNEYNEYRLEPTDNFKIEDIPVSVEVMLYAHPPQRTWQGLTNDELTDLFYNRNLGQASAVAQAIALLKERNT